MNLKGILLTIYIGITIFMFINLKVSFPLWSSFFLTAVILFAITAYHLYYEKEYSPFLSSFIVFTFLFFLANLSSYLDWMFLHARLAYKLRKTISNRNKRIVT